MSARMIACLVIGWLLLSPAGASARDVCVQDDAGYWLFKKVKIPKKPGSIAPLTGVYVEAGEVAPASGTGYVIADGRVVVGMTAHGFAPLDNKVLTTNRAVTFAVDAKTFQGVGYTDVDGDGSLDTSDGWTPVDCSEVVLP